MNLLEPSNDTLQHTNQVQDSTNWKQPKKKRYTKSDPASCYLLNMKIKSTPLFIYKYMIKTIIG